MQIRYDYTTSMPHNNTEYGDTRLTYLTSRPLNLTRSFQRFSLQAGPVLNYLIDKKDNNTVVIYNNGEPTGAYFEQKGSAKKFLAGVHLNARYAVTKRLEIMLGGQYFMSATYKEQGKPRQVQLGVSYTLKH